MFRALVFQRKALNLGAIANLRILKATINEDLTQKATSSLTCVEVPRSVSQYDVIMVYDTKGSFSYWGVINSIADNTIKCSQFQSFFNRDMLFVPDNTYFTSHGYLDEYATKVLSDLKDGHFSTPSQTTPISEDGDVVENYLRVKIDSGIISTQVPKIAEKYVQNVESFIYDMFNQYNVFVIPVYVENETYYGYKFIDVHITNAKNSTITIYGKAYDYTTARLVDSYDLLSNIQITKKEEDVDTVYIYNSAGTTFRGAYTMKNDGTYVQITNTDPIANRIGSNKIKYVFDDNNNLLILAKQVLPNDQYNHKITFDILFNDKNKFDSYKLGKFVNFFDNTTNNMYNSVLTAWSYNIEENSDEIKKASFTLGKVRTNLTSKLLKGNV